MGVENTFFSVTLYNFQKYLCVCVGFIENVCVSQFYMQTFSICLEKINKKCW